MFTRVTYSENPLFAEFRRFEQELEGLFGADNGWAGGIRSLPATTFPPINVGSTDDGVTVYVFAPGIDPKKLNITLQQNVLSISGQRVVPTHKDATYYRQERFGGEFHRALTLPEGVDPTRVEASYRDGIVQIQLHRQQSAKPRQIEIR